jgi:ribosomal protein L33
MSVEWDKAIYFDCEECSHGQYADYSLVSDWVDGRAVNAATIECSECKHPNFIVEDL